MRRALTISTLVAPIVAIVLTFGDSAGFHGAACARPGARRAARARATTARGLPATAARAVSSAAECLLLVVPAARVRAAARLCATAARSRGTAAAPAFGLGLWRLHRLRRSGLQHIVRHRSCGWA
jgi:hypothetical protein